MDIFNPTSADALLFHYTSLNTALVHILPEKKLRMGPFLKTADPRENKDWNFHVTTSGTAALDGWEIENRVAEESDRVQAELRVLCLTQDDLNDNGETPIEKRGFGLSRMWDRYGERHRGVCLALDAMALSRAVIGTVSHGVRIWVGPVTYGLLARDRRPEWDVNGDGVAEIGEEAEIRHHISVFYNKLLFTKSSDWSSEREYRWVYLAHPGESEIFVPLEKPLRAVILGSDLSNSYYPSFRATCSSNLPIYEMRWNWGCFQKPWLI